MAFCPRTKSYYADAEMLCNDIAAIHNGTVIVSSVCTWKVIAWGRAVVIMRSTSMSRTGNKLNIAKENTVITLIFMGI